VAGGAHIVAVEWEPNSETALDARQNGGNLGAPQRASVQSYTVPAALIQINVAGAKKVAPFVPQKTLS
jgi:hypothetical protein